MKSSAELQQQSFFRKIAYFGVILVLFSVMTFSGRIYSMFTGAPSKWTVTSQSRRLQLNESDQGEADLAGSTVRLALSGSRGFAISMFWLATIEKQKKHEWNEVELLVNTMTKLQPHFLTPWLFQSWNLAYNVSVESDRVRDKYFYISRGIELLAEGERINRARVVDENGQELYVGNPDMRFWIGFYYMNKFGTSDEQHTLRSLFQLSCINPAKRNPNLLRRDGRSVDRQAFQEFVQQNPMLCRRLRDFLRCSQPEDVIDFLADNGKVPSRYEEMDSTWHLKRRPETQFPVLPVMPATAELASPHSEFGGNFDSYHAAWAWQVYAQEPLPPVEYGKPAAGVPKFDLLRYRLPRAPAGIIFRQQPPRNLSYIAERLQKEGWFDDTGWDVDEGRQTDQWFPEQRIVVGNDSRYSSKTAWQAAYQSWERHGKEHGLLLSEAEKRNLATLAEPYKVTFGLEAGGPAPELVKDRVKPELYQSFDAFQQLQNLSINLNMTNFRHFLYRSQAESDDRTVRMRRLFHEAERLQKSANQKQSIRRYQEAFTVLTGDPATGKQGLLDAFPEFRNDATMQEELIEKHMAYLNLLEEEHGTSMRRLFTFQNLAGAAATRSGPELFSSLLYHIHSRPRELPSLFLGPLDGKDGKGEPWVSEVNVNAVKMRKGLIKVAPQAPVAPPGMGPPAMAPPQ